MNRFYWTREYREVGQSSVGLAPQIFDHEQPSDEPIAHATSVESAEKIVAALNACEKDLA